MVITYFFNNVFINVTNYNLGGIITLLFSRIKYCVTLKNCSIILKNIFGVGISIDHYRWAFKYLDVENKTCKYIKNKTLESTCVKVLASCIKKWCSLKKRD